MVCSTSPGDIASFRQASDANSLTTWTLIEPPERMISSARCAFSWAAESKYNKRIRSWLGTIYTYSLELGMEYPRHELCNRGLNLVA